MKNGRVHPENTNRDIPENAKPLKMAGPSTAPSGGEGLCPAPLTPLSFDTWAHIRFTSGIHCDVTPLEKCIALRKDPLCLACHEAAQVEHIRNQKEAYGL